jgi:hypothetical protein
MSDSLEADVFQSRLDALPRSRKAHGPNDAGAARTTLKGSGRRLWDRASSRVLKK